MGVSGRLSETTKERLLQSGQYQYQVCQYQYQVPVTIPGANTNTRFAITNTRCGSNDTGNSVRQEASYRERESLSLNLVL